MSYQNPLTLTPKLYQSSDPQAPQLLGQLGDFKSVFKACLVTGYGTKQGAGFTIENETSVSAEFVSPNIMMSKIGVEEDNSYCYSFHYDGEQKLVSDWTTGVIPTYEIGSANWTMLACELGVYFIVTKNGMSQIVYMGLVKSAINDNNKNIMRLNIGSLYSSSSTYPINYVFRLGSNTTNVRILSNGASLSNNYYKDTTFFISLVSDMFFASNGNILASLPNILIKNAMTQSLEKSTLVTEYQGRPVLSVFVANGTREDVLTSNAFGAYIYLDQWEY